METRLCSSSLGTLYSSRTTSSFCVSRLHRTSCRNKSGDHQWHNSSGHRPRLPPPPCSSRILCCLFGPPSMIQALLFSVLPMMVAIVTPCFYLFFLLLPLPPSSATENLGVTSTHPMLLAQTLEWLSTMISSSTGIC